MQQAARISDETAFFYLGNLVEYNKTDNDISNPDVKHTEDYITEDLAENQLEELHGRKKAHKLHIMKWNCRK